MRETFRPRLNDFPCKLWASEGFGHHCLGPVISRFHLLAELFLKKSQIFRSQFSTHLLGRGGTWDIGRQGLVKCDGEAIQAGLDGRGSA